MSKTASIFKQLVDSGAFKPEMDMCDVLKTAYLKSGLRFWKIPSANRAHEELNEFIHFLAPEHGIRTLRFSLITHFYYFRDVTLTTKTISDLSIRLFSDWDSRFSILKEFANAERDDYA